MPTLTTMSFSLSAAASIKPHLSGDALLPCSLPIRNLSPSDRAALAGEVGWRRSGRHRDHGVTVGGLAIGGVGFPQSRELESFTQIPERERAEREPVFVRLDPVAVFEHEHQVCDVLPVEAIGHLPGVEHDAPPPA